MVEAKRSKTIGIRERCKLLGSTRVRKDVGEGLEWGKRCAA